jgi:hypothetical protein
VENNQIDYSSNQAEYFFANNPQEFRQTEVNRLQKQFSLAAASFLLLFL